MVDSTERYAPALYFLPVGEPSNGIWDSKVLKQSPTDAFCTEMFYKQRQSHSFRLRRKVIDLNGLVGNHTASLYVKTRMLPHHLNHKSVPCVNAESMLTLGFAQRVAIGIEVPENGRWAESA